MPLACIYSPTEKMRVVTLEERETLVASGKWFKHPNDVHVKKDINHEEPIRQRTRKRRVADEHPPSTL